MFAEMYVEQMARTLGRPVDEIRAANMQREGYVTHYGQAMENCHIGSCWEQVIKTSDYAARSVGLWFGWPVAEEGHVRIPLSVCLSNVLMPL